MNDREQWNGTWFCDNQCTYWDHGFHTGQCFFVPKSREEIQKILDEDLKKREKEKETLRRSLLINPS